MLSGYDCWWTIIAYELSIQSVRKLIITSILLVAMCGNELVVKGATGYFNYSVSHIIHAVLI